MIRVVETEMNDEIYGIAFHALKAKNSYPGIDFVNFILPSPTPFTWEMPDGAEPCNEVCHHGTIDTRAGAITPDLYYRAEWFGQAYSPILRCYHIVYKDHDFYFCPEECKVFVRTELKGVTDG